jgi:hypothetical protein
MTEENGVHIREARCQAGASGRVVQVQSASASIRAGVSAGAGAGVSVSVSASAGLSPMRMLGERILGT